MAKRYTIHLCRDCGGVLLNRNGHSYECNECGVIWNKADL